MTVLIALLLLAGACLGWAQEPLRVYISVDMEGISGIVHSEMTSAAGKEYDRGREFMTEDVNAAIQGALDAGATEILVNDSHGSHRNILIEDLLPQARLISNSSKPLGMMEGISSDFHAVFFIGYHARAGNDKGLLAHTGTGVVVDLRVNGRSLSEGGMNAPLAGSFGVPVVLATGDEAFVNEIRELLGDLETVAVKRALRRETAEQLSPVEARKAIRSAAARALKRRNSIKPFRLTEPVTVDLVYDNYELADIASAIPGISRTGPRAIQFQSPRYPEAYRFIRVLYRHLQE